MKYWEIKLGTRWYPLLKESLPKRPGPYSLTISNIYSDHMLKFKAYLNSSLSHEEEDQDE